MSTLAVNSITDANGGNTATINSMTPTADSLQGFRNRIINGDMRIDQRNAGASVNGGTTVVFPVDRWNAYGDQNSKFTLQQSSTAAVGFNNSVLVTSSSAYSVGSGDRFIFRQAIEGFNCGDLMWGTANAKTVTLSFWVRSSLTGTFGGAIRSYSGTTRSYPFSYTINTSNTWEQKSVTIPGDTSGTWTVSSTGYMYVAFGIGVGSTYSGAADSWSTADYWSVTGATSVVGTNGATWYITGVQLEVGSVATPFERRPYGTELSLCQRYYWQTGGVFGNIPAWTWTSTQFGTTMWHPTTMRAAPTIATTTATNAYNFYMAGSITQFNSVSGNNLNIFCADIFATTSGKTAGQGGFFAVGAGGNITFSAEL